MKHHAFKRALAALLCLLLVGSTVAIAVPVYAASEVSVQNGTGTREPIRVGKTYSYRAKVNGEFTAFGYCMPTWNKTDSYATLSIFKWQGSYDKTVAAEPIAKKSFTLVDGQYHWVEFDTQPAGEYLFHISDGGSDVGVWTNSGPTDSKGLLYIDGIEQRGEPELKIRFTEEIAEPFGVCEPSGNTINVVSPYASQSDKSVFGMNGSMGLRLNVASSFIGVQFNMATYMATDIEIDMSVYAWKGSYDKTIAETPVASGHLTLVDNAMQGVTFDEVPAGDYLFLAHNYTKTPAMYVYDSVKGFKGYIYNDGLPMSHNTKYPIMQVVFNKEKDDYFLDCSAPNDGITGDHTAPEEYVIPEDSLIYTHEVMPDTWVFTDGLGRVSLTNADVGDLRDNKTLAIFYWTWHIDGFTNNVPINLQEYSEKYPEAMRDFNSPIWDGTDTYWWNKSIYGYYRGDDKWVLRKQAELLANAGVDVIFTDNTNAGMTWRNSYTPLMEAWTEAMEDGLKTPKVSFMLPFWDKDYTNVQLQSLYLDIYRADKCQNLWFYWDGKPMLMAMGDSVNPSASAIEKEISNFFTFRAGQPGYVVNRTSYANWGWLSMYPQALYYKDRAAEKAGEVEQMTVGVSMNHDYEKGLLAAMSGNHIAGRSYTSTYKDRYDKEGAEASKWGYNFAEQWNYALEVDPQVVFVTGWNEFRVGRYAEWPEGSASAVTNAFPDQFNDEFSRDIEPTKGNLQDHYYYQLVNFSRQFKGARPIPTPSTKTTIDLSAGQEQWTAVEPYYAAYIGNTDNRDHQGYGDLVYTETSGRNDIIGAQIARDDEYVYFHVECAADITPYTDALWMNLYIDTDPSNQGWNTFEFVVNKSPAGEKTLVLEKFTAENDYNATEKVADVAYTVDGRYMTVKIAKSDLGLAGNDYTINFSWTDNVHDENDYTKFSGDILDFYISGDVAPGGRFKYSYISTAANAGENGSDETEADTAEVTKPAADSESADTAEPQNPAETEPVKGGCKSSVGGMGTVAVAMAAAGVALCKTKSRETGRRKERDTLA